MKINYFITIIIFIVACTSKAKEGAFIHIYNESNNDIFIIDKYSFENNVESKIKIFDEGFSSFTGKRIPYLKPEYITRYTNKTIFFPIEDYQKNKKYNLLTFYIIRQKDIDKPKLEIQKRRLYDSINIKINDFHPYEYDNHLYISNNKLDFQNF